MLDTPEAFKMMGLLFGHGILTPRQLLVVKKEWLNPTYYFNRAPCGASTTSAPRRWRAVRRPVIMELHIALHALLVK